MSFKDAWKQAKEVAQQVKAAYDADPEGTKAALKAQASVAGAQVKEQATQTVAKIVQKYGPKN